MRTTTATAPAAKVAATATDTFNERKFSLVEAAKQLGLSKATMKRLALIELNEGATDIGTARIGPKRAHTLYTFTESALRRIHSKLTGGYFGRPVCQS